MFNFLKKLLPSKHYMPGPTFEKCTFGGKYVEWHCICNHTTKKEHEEAKELYLLKEELMKD
jgi:hypothetical protein